jgi:hypothetical protein
VSEKQHRADDHLIIRDVIVRALAALGLVGAFLAALIAIHPN